MGKGRAIAAAGILMLVLSYWVILAIAGERVIIAPLRGHDGLSCSTTLAGSASESTCGLSITPLFAITLGIVFAAAVLSIAATWRDGARVPAAIAAAAALALAIAEFWLGRGSFGGTLSPTRFASIATATAIATALLVLPGALKPRGSTADA